MSNSEPPREAMPLATEMKAAVASHPPSLRLLSCPTNRKGPPLFTKVMAENCTKGFLEGDPLDFPRESGIIYVLDISLARSVGVHCLAQGTREGAERWS